MKCGHGGDIYTNSGIRLDFSINVNPLGMPGFVKEAAIESLSRCGCYPDPSCRRLKRAAAARYLTDEDTLIFGNGAAELIFTCVQARKPERAVLMAPGFAEYEEALKTVGAKRYFFYLKEEDHFAFSARRYRAFLEEVKPDMIFLCNPSNPLGMTFCREDCAEILEYCGEHGIFIVADECFLEFLPDADGRSLLGEVRAGRKGLFVLKALTKTFAMAGLRLGYGFSADRQFLDTMESLIQPWNVSLPAQEAGTAAFENGGEAFLASARRLLAAERPFIIEEMGKYGFQVFGSEANFILFRDLTGKPGYCLYRYLLQKGILIRPCGNFRGLSENDYRVCIRTHAENLELLRVIGEYVKS